MNNFTYFEAHRVEKQVMKHSAASHNLVFGALYWQYQEQTLRNSFLNTNVGTPIILPTSPKITHNYKSAF